MPSFCIVSDCELKYTHDDNVSHHKFPYHSPEILAKWINFTDRGPDWEPTKWSAICSRHFRPSDFRNGISRKYLKKSAVPSIKVKSYTGNFLEEHAFDVMKLQVTSGESIESNCRLCGISPKVAETFANNLEIEGMLQKCFPSLNFQLDDDLPKNICSTCLDRLNVFSDFVDIVLRTQKELEDKYQRTHHNTTTTQTAKTIKIKQEPVIKVKQEVNETIFNTVSNIAGNDHSLIPHQQEDKEKEQKSKIPNNPPAIINSDEIINNCDIMEIVTLDDGCIDIPDDEAAEDEPSPTPQSTDSIVCSDDHNYAKAQIISNQLLNVPYYKLETMEEQDLGMPKTSVPKIYVIDDSIVNSVPSIAAYQCDACALVFLDKTTLSEHKSLYHATVVRKCVRCNLQFDSLLNFLKHKSKVHFKDASKRVTAKNNLTCIMCEKAFKSKLALNNHRKYLCEYQNKQEYACKHCGKLFQRRILLRRHEKECKTTVVQTVINHIQDCPQLPSPPTVTTNICTTPTTTIPATMPIESRPKVTPNATGRFDCPSCDRSYTRRHTLHKHERTHRPQSSWNHKCGDCNQLFDHIYDLRRHLKSKSCQQSNQPISVNQDDRRTSSNAQQQQPPQPLFFICTICGKKLKSLQRLRMHNMLHLGKRPYVCELCGKSFVNVNNLHQHSVTHTNLRRYKCDLCEKVFKRRGGLNQHKRSYHFKIKPHECPTCKHRFALKNDMLKCKHSILRQIAE